MKDLLIKIFRSSKYNETKDAFGRIKRTYAKGYKKYLSVNKLTDDASYHFMNIICCAEKQIIELDSIIRICEKLKVEKPNGVRLFLLNRKKSSNNLSRHYDLLASNENEIRRIEQEYQECKRLEANYSKGITHFGSYETIEDIKKILSNREEIVRIHGIISKVEYLRKHNPQGYLYICKQNNFPSTRESYSLIFDKICELENDIINADRIIKEYRSIMDLYPIGCVYYNYNCHADDLSYMESIIAQKAQIQHAQEVCVAFEKLHLTYSEAVDYYIEQHGVYTTSLGIAGLNTLEQKEYAVSHKADIEAISDDLNVAVKISHDYPLAWEQLLKELNLDSIYQMDLYTIGRIPEYELDQVEQYILKCIENNHGIIETRLITGDNNYDGSIFNGKNRETERLYIRLVSCPITTSEKLVKSCKCENRYSPGKIILKSEKYGDIARFDESFNEVDFFKLQIVCEQNYTTFDKATTFVKCNDAAIKAYNKSRGSEAVVYTNDYEKAAREQRDFMSFIEDFNRRAEEERAKQEARRREQEIQEAKNILSQYGDAAKRCGCSYSIYSLSYDQAKNVLRKKGEIEALSSKINRLRNAVSGWNSIKGIIPHYFFYYYYPTRFTDVTLTSDSARRLIWNFKDGMRSSEVANLVANKLKQTFISSDLGGLCFMCVPASTRITNENRYRAFAEMVCSETGMTNGYRYISIVREKEPSHLGGTTPAEYSYDESAIKGSFIVLFDDVVTTGHSMRDLKNKLENMGAIVVCAISIGRTYSDYFGANHQPHPYTGAL